MCGSLSHSTWMQRNVHLAPSPAQVEKQGWRACFRVRNKGWGDDPHMANAQEEAL